jgi:TrmH family RNA methyltransferase
MLVKSQVKYIQSLGQKKFRDGENVFVSEGPKIINELLMATNCRPVNIFAVKEWVDANRNMINSLQADQFIEIKDHELQRISFLTTPNQVLAVFSKPHFEKTGAEDKVSLVLDGIRDPGNLGTIVRIADWFGVQHIICSEDCADVFNPKTIQSTMGSISRVEVLYEDLETFIASHHALPVYAATLDGTNLYEMKRIKKGLIVIGNESKGISPEILALIQHRITIPGSGNAESLNAAVAAGIVLSHLV